MRASFHVFDNKKMLKREAIRWERIAVADFFQL
jgi:hypothetical protein